MSKFKVGDRVATKDGLLGVVISVDATFDYNNVNQPIHAKFYDDGFEYSEYFFEDGKYVIDDNSIWDIRKATKLEQILK